MRKVLHWAGEKLADVAECVLDFIETHVLSLPPLLEDNWEEDDF